MIYSEEVADKIIGKYNLSAQTKVTWKWRGVIPDRYRGEFELRNGGVATDRMLYLQDNVIKSLSTGKINRRYMLTCLGLRPSLINEVAREHINFTKKELLAICQYLLGIKNKIKAVVVTMQHKEDIDEFTDSHVELIIKLLQTENFVFLYVCKGYLTRKQYGRWIDLKNGTFRYVDAEMMRKTVEAFTHFMLEIKL